MPRFPRIAFDLPGPGTEGLMGAALRRGVLEDSTFDESIPETRLPVPASHENRLALVEIGDPDDLDAWENLEDRIRLRPGVVRTGPVVRKGRRSVSFLSRRFIVKFSSSASARPHDVVTDPRWASAGVQLLGRLPYVAHGFLFRIHHARPVAQPGARPLPRVIEICRTIMDDFGSDVDFAEPDLVTSLDLAYDDPSDAEFANQWNLHDIHVDGAWREIDAAVGGGLQFGDPAVRVAIVDYQIDTTHQEFQASLSDGRPRFELVPFDFMDGSFIDSESIAATAHFHGTGTAGIVGSASGDHSIVGTAPNCQMMAVTLGTLTTVDLMNAMYWAAGFDPTIRETRDLAYPPPPDPGADVILCSWQKPISATDLAAISHIAGNGRGGKGTVIVFAAGLPPAAGDPENFAGLPDVITVAGYTIVDQKRKRISESALGVADVAAPTEVRTCALTAYADPYTDLGGTSMAAPHVAGVVALMLSANPGLTFEQAKNIVRFSVMKDRWESLEGETFAEAFGQGVLDARQAVLNALKLRPVLHAAFVGPTPDPVVDRPVDLKVTVRNDGSTEAPATVLRSEVRREQTGETLGVLEHAIPVLPPEGLHDVRRTVTPTSAGGYVVELQADANGDIRGGQPGEIVRERFEVSP